MKTEKTIKKKSPTATAKVAAPAPAIKAPDAMPERQNSLKVEAVQAPAAPVVTPKAVSAAPRREITSELIAARAYTIWEQQGRPQGSDVANWLLAESQLKREIQSFTA